MRIPLPVPAAVAAALLAGLAAQPALAAAEPQITELHYDNAGTDTGEAVEITASPGTPLDGWSLVLYNGVATVRAPYSTTTLSGLGTTTVDFPSNGIQNGDPDGLALVRPDGSVAQFLSYEGVFTAASGAAAGMTSTDIGVAQTGTTPAGYSLQFVDGAWTGPAPSTFVRRSSAPVSADCDVRAAVTAMDVQGSGSSTPLNGHRVAIEGVVVADLQVGGYNGFFIQDATGDGDAATSDAVFVHAPRAQQVSLGDHVQVAGEAGEFNGLTQISADEVDVCATGTDRPAPAVLPLPGDGADRERLEGMRVTATDLTVTEVFALNRFGEVVLSSGGVLHIPTEVAEPGPAADAVRAENLRRRIVLDDGRTANLLTTREAPPFLAPGDPVRVGDRVSVLQDVVLSYGFGAWRLQPADGTADGTTFDATNPRPEHPADVGGRHRVASFNVLNYFTTIPSGDGPRSPRGADTPEEFARQQAKIVSAINRLNADVVALMEVENSAALGEPKDEALATLVAALNAAAGEGTWAFVPSPSDLPPAEEQDVITNALIYRPATVGLWREAVSLSDQPGTPAEEQNWDNAREPIAQTFVARGDRFTVVANHLKSKSTGGATGDNRDTGQGAYNADRIGQAQALAGFVEELQTHSGDEDVILLGDFNSYAKEDPLDVLRGAGLVEVSEGAGDSYVFGGESGSLDHAFATPSFAAQVTGAQVWRINSPESIAYQYNGVPSLYAPDPYRASDHDPIVVGFEPVPGRSK